MIGTAEQQEENSIIRVAELQRHFNAQRKVGLLN